jgi:hypothetical protein
MKSGGHLESPAATRGGERWRRRAKRGAAGVGALVLLYAVVAGWIAPRVVRSQAQKRLGALVGGPVTIGQVAFHPFALRARITDFRLAEPDGRVLLSWSNVVADAELASLWRGELVLASVAVDRLRLDLRRDRDQRINLVEFLARLHAAQAPAAGSVPPPESSSASSNLFPVTLGMTTFTHGAVVFRDEALAEPFEARLEPIDFQLAALTTRPGGDGRLTLTAAGDSGERIDWQARLGVNPPVVEGEVKGTGLKLARPRPYTDPITSLRPTDGVLAFSVPFRVSLVGGVFEGAITNASLHLTRLAVAEGANGAPFAEVGGLALEGVAASLHDRVARVGALRIEGGSLHVRRHPSSTRPGTTESNLRGLIRPEVIEELVRDLTDWRLRLDDVAIAGVKAELEDTALDPPVRLGVEGVGLRVRGLSNETNTAPFRIEAGLRWGESGAVRAEGDGTVFPARGRVTLALENLGIAPLSPYVAQFLRLQLNRGTVAGAFEAEYGAAASGPLVRGRGRLAVTDFAATEAVSGTDFIRWDAVEANGLAATAEPGRFELDELVIRKLQTSLVVTSNGQLNVLQLLRETRELGEAPEPKAGGEPGDADRAGKEPAKERGKATAPAEAAVTGDSPKQDAPPFWESWPVRLGKLRLEQVALFAADQFYGGGFRTSVESLDGEVRNLALPAQTPAEIDLAGRLSAVSGFTAKGTLNPDPARFAADFTVGARRADLAQFSPYTLRFAGYPVTRGELTGEVHYLVEGDNLKAENKLLLDQFTLGAKVKSPDAVDLPLKLGVALMKDAEGRINLDLPLAGTLSDPQFRLAPLVWQVLRNVIVKATTAPFRFLGSLFGGGKDEELEFVEFAPGSAELRPDQTNRLSVLVRALGARPQLGLAILPGFDPVADKGALATNAVLGQLRKLRLEELAMAGFPPPAPDAVPLTPEDRDRLVPALFVQVFGALPTTAPAVTSPGATNATAPAVTVSPTALAPAETPPPAAPVWTTAQLEQRLVETRVIEPAEFQGLARRRAEAVRAALTADAAVAADRVTLDPEATGHPAEGKTRAAFRLE